MRNKQNKFRDSKQKSFATEQLQSDRICHYTIVCLCLQGEQCNIVPDNVDDIVADIAQEEKDEGLDFAPISPSFFLTQDSKHS